MPSWVYEALNSEVGSIHLKVTQLGAKLDTTKITLTRKNYVVRCSRVAKRYIVCWQSKPIRTLKSLTNNAPGDFETFQNKHSVFTRNDGLFTAP